MDEALRQQWGDFRGGRMGHRVCPWWLGYVLASPLRRLLQDPAAVVKPYVREGMTVLEPGPGMGFFTLEMARQVGASGGVVAVDIQPRMIAGLQRRLAKAGYSSAPKRAWLHPILWVCRICAAKLISRSPWRSCTKCPVQAASLPKLRRR